MNDNIEIEVSETHDQLVKLLLQLRLKPNKDLLSELINKAENTDQTKYTAVSTLLSLKSALVKQKQFLIITKRHENRSNCCRNIIENSIKQFGSERNYSR